jgi:hypothetical protein
MNESHNPEEAEQSGKEHLKAAAADLKASATGKIEDLRQTVGQKTEEFRKAAADKAKEASSAAEPQSMLGPVLLQKDGIGSLKPRPMSARIRLRLC